MDSELSVNLNLKTEGIFPALAEHGQGAPEYVPPAERVQEALGNIATGSPNGVYDDEDAHRKWN